MIDTIYQILSKNIIRASRASTAWVPSCLIQWTLLALLSAIVFGQIAINIGVDANWDLRNYHLYNPFAVIEGRYDIDHNPAGLQSYINPTLDLLLTFPAYNLVDLRFATQLTGAIQGLNFVLILAITFMLTRGLGISDRRIYFLLGFVVSILGMTGALTFSELGTSFGDLSTALVVLVGMLLALCSVSEQDGALNLRMVASAGVVLGIAAGLKLTNGTYLTALIIALVLMDSHDRLRTALAFGMAAVVGFMVAHGWWSWFLWQKTGNPIFPFFNELFGSTYYPDKNFFDGRFYPRNWLQALTYPFWFSWNHQTAETRFIDFRFPIAYVLSVGILFKLAWEKLTKNSKTILKPDERRFWIFSIFLIASYIIWQNVFSIQRYAITIEVLLPTFILIAFRRIFGRFWLGLFGATALLLLITTDSPSWGRLRKDRAYASLIPNKVQRQLSSLLDGAVVIQGGQPLGYVAAAFPSTNITWIGELMSEEDIKRAQGKIVHRRKLFTLLQQDPKDAGIVRKKLELLGLPLPHEFSDCRTLPTVFESLQLCEVESFSAKL